MKSLINLLLILLALNYVRGKPAFGDDANQSQCSADVNTEKICNQCLGVPFGVGVTMDSCCNDRHAFLFCEACLDDLSSCKKLMEEIDEVKEFSDNEDAYDDYYDSNENIDEREAANDGYGQNDEMNMLNVIDPSIDVNKRFGKLFVNSRKRLGRIFGKRSNDVAERFRDKRYGRIFVSKSPWNFFGKRSSDYFENEPITNINKRYARVFMGRAMKPKGRFFGNYGKRSSNAIWFDDSVPEKRYGMLSMSGGKYRFGKRSEGDLESEWDSFEMDDSTDNADVDKRWGRLYMGSKGKSRFGKRSE